MGSFYGRLNNSGGGGGTSNYNELSNKPKINGSTLLGNKTLEQLGIATKISDLPNDKGYVTASILPIGGKTGQVLAKHSNLDYDIEWINQEEGGGDVSSVNGQTGDVVLKISDLQNDSGFITKSVDDLTNYTTTSGMNTALSGKVNNSSVGTAGGVAELDNTGKVPSSQLPSYVDDVVDGYYNETDGKFYEESTYTTEIAGEAGKIYISVDTDLQYRWTGSAFAAMGGALVLGETSSTAYRGDRGKTAYDDSQTNKANIGTMANLTTTEKESLVGAVNELAGRTEGHTIKDEGTAKTARESLNFIDHDITDDSTNNKTDVAPHELTSAEWSDIMPVLPGINSGGVIFDERGTEYVVGQYIHSDGTKQPIYEKHFNPSSTLTIPNNNTDGLLEIVDLSTYNIEYMINIYGSCKSSGGDIITNFPCVMSIGTANNWMIGTLKYFDNKLNLQARRTNNSSVVLSDIRVAIQYTKSTDTPV